MGKDMVDFEKVQRYFSWKHYCEACPDRDKRFDEFARLSLKEHRYIQIHLVKMLHTEAVIKFVRKIEEAHRGAAKSKLVFKCSEAA